MRKFSTLIHLKDPTQNIADTLESLKLSDEIVVIDHTAAEESKKLLRAQGAKVIEAIAGVQSGAYVTNTRNDWVLCLLPSESVSDDLCAALEKWREGNEETDAGLAGYTIAVKAGSSKMRNGDGPQLRFVNRTRINWTGELPGEASNVSQLPGFLRRKRPE